MESPQTYLVVEPGKLAGAGERSAVGAELGRLVVAVGPGWENPVVVGRMIVLVAGKPVVGTEVENTVVVAVGKLVAGTDHEKIADAGPGKPVGSVEVGKQLVVVVAVVVETDLETPVLEVERETQIVETRDYQTTVE